MMSKIVILSTELISTADNQYIYMNKFNQLNLMKP